MRIALVTILCLFARAAGAEPVKPELTADVLVRSSREAPPQRFLDVLAELRGMGVALRKGVPAQGWAPKAPCGDQAPRCSTLPFCVGLRTAYWSELVGKPFGYRFDVLAWTYDTRESAKRARDHLRGGPTFYIQHVEVLADSDTTLLLLVGRWPDAHVFERVGRQLRKRLGQADPVAAAVDGGKVLVMTNGRVDLPPDIKPILTDENGEWIAMRGELAYGLLFRPELKPGMLEDMIMEEGRPLPENISVVLDEARVQWNDSQRTTDRVLAALVTALDLMRERRKMPVFKLNPVGDEG